MGAVGAHVPALHFVNRSSLGVLVDRTSPTALLGSLSASAGLSFEPPESGTVTHPTPG